MEQNITFAEFFAGSGLVSSALSKSFELKWANDFSEKKAQIFYQNHPSHLLVNKDLSTLSSRDIPAVDLAWASFPCQDLSLAGSLQGINGLRSGLVWTWIQQLEQHQSRPKVLVLENVTGLVSRKSGEDYILLHRKLSQLGYQVGVIELNASHWLPHSRPRVFVLCVDQSIDINSLVRSNPNWAHSKAIQKVSAQLDGFVFWDLTQPRSNIPALRDIVDTDLQPSLKSNLSGYFSLSEKRQILKDLRNSETGVFTAYRRTRNGKAIFEVRRDGVAGCLRTAKGGSSKQVVIYECKGKFVARYLLAQEACLLMGVPKEFQAQGSENQVYSAMGDAVAFPVVDYLRNKFLIKVFNECPQTRITRAA